MPTTPTLGITQVSASQSQKEVTINDAIQALENATNKKTVVNFGATATATLSAATAQGAMIFRATNASGDATLNFPNTVNGVGFNRLVVVRNDCGHLLTVKYTTGAGTTVTIPNGEGRLLGLLDGTDVIVAAEPAAGASFVNLSDTPANYTGSGGKVLAVKVDESGVEFITLTGGSDLPDLTSNAAKVLAVKGDESGTEWVPQSGGSGGAPFMGARRVRPSTALTAISTWTAVPHPNAAFDTNGFITGTTGFTIPAGFGITKVRLRFSLQETTADPFANNQFVFYKNGAQINFTSGGAVMEVIPAAGYTNGGYTLVSGVVDATAGDIFDAYAFLAESAEFISAFEITVVETTAVVPLPVAPVLTITDTAVNLDAANVGKYHRFTAATAKGLTVRAQADHALPTDGEWHIRNAGAGDLTVIAASGVTIIPPAGGTLVVPERGSVTLKQVGVNTLDLIGQTVAA